MDASRHLICSVLVLCIIGRVASESSYAFTKEILEMNMGYMSESGDRGGSINGWTSWKPEFQADQISEQCRKDMEVIMAAQQTPQNHTWIFNVQDSMGSFPDSGVLLGRVYSLGSYDECLQIKPTYQSVYEQNATGEMKLAGVHDFDMHYCLTKWYLTNVENGFSGEGLCVPKSCDRNDVVKLMPKRPMTKNHEAYCGTKPPLSQNVGAIVALSIFSVFVALVLIATLFDAIFKKWEENRQVHASPPSDSKGQGQVNASCEGTGMGDKTKIITENGGETVNTGEKAAASITEVGTAAPLPLKAVNEPKAQKPSLLVSAMRALLCFSICRNLPTVIQTQSRGYDCMNGLRFLAMTWILMGHTWTLFSFPYSTNILQSMKLGRRFGHLIINNMNLSVDVFFFLGGTLVTLSFLKTLQRLKKEPKETRPKSVAKEMALYVFHRYWRLTPLYAAILMVATNLWRYMGEGPMFPEARLEMDACQADWWKNLLYVNNFTGIECMKWCWYLANDFQFYLIVPLFATALFLNPTGGSILLTLGWTGSLICRTALTLQRKTGFEEMYVKPWARFGTYAIGIATGYLMYRTKCKVKMNKIVVCIGWLAAVAICMAVVFGTYKRDTWSDDLKAAYHITQRDAFTLGIAWVVFACSCGYGGLFNTFLAWRLWIPLSRLSYASYLIHPIVGFLAVTTRRQQFSIQDITMIYEHFGVLMISLALSLGMTLVFEVPFLALEKVILPARKK